MAEAPVPSYKLRSSDFVDRAIAIVVNPTMVGGNKLLVCTEGSTSERVRFEREIERLAPSGMANLSAWVKERVDDFFAECFPDDAWHSVLPSGTPVVLLKESAIEGRMAVKDALRRVHTSEVSRAIAAGVEVPSAVLDDHRVFIQAMSADREGF